MELVVAGVDGNSDTPTSEGSADSLTEWTGAGVYCGRYFLFVYCFAILKAASKDEVGKYF